MANTINIVLKATDLASREILKVEGGLAGLVKQIGNFTGASGIGNAAAATLLWNKELKKAKLHFAYLEEAAKKLLSISTKITFAGIGALAASAFPIVEAAAFEKSMSKVKAILDDVSEDSMVALTNKAREMGETTKFSARESAEAFTYLAMAGLSASESIDALPGILQLAAAGGIDLAVAADLATNVLAGMGKSVKELGNVNDVLAKAASKSNTSVLELGEAMKIAGPAALGSGEAIESVVAALGGLANAGIKGGEGGNAVKRMLIQLQNPSKEAADTLTRLGIETVALDGSFRGLLPVLEDLGRAELNLADSSKIFGLYTGAAAVAAATQAAGMYELRDALYDADGAAEKMALTMQDNVAGAFTKVLSATEGFWLAIATPLQGFTQLMLEWAAKVISFGTKIVSMFSYIAGAILSAVAIFGVLATALGSLGVAVSVLLLGYIKLRTAMLVVNAVGWVTTRMLASQRIAALANATGFSVLWKALIAAKTATNAVNIANLRAIGIMNLLTAATLRAKDAVLFLWRIMKAHPLVAFVAATVAVFGVLKNHVTKLRESAAAANAHAESIRTIVDSYDALKVAFTNAQVAGSTEEQSEAASALRDWLVKVADENKTLAASALTAANALNTETGEFNDGGVAIEEFHQKLRQVNFEAIIEQLHGLQDAVRADTPNVKQWEAGWTGAVHGLWLAFAKQFNRIEHLTGIHFQDWTDRSKKMEDDWVNAIEAMAQKSKLLVKDMMSAGNIDPNVTLEEFKAIIEEIPDLTDAMQSTLLAAFSEIQREGAATSIVLDSSLTSETRRAKIQKVADDYRLMADDIIGQYKRIAEESEASATAGGVERRSTAYQKVVALLPQYISSIRNVTTEEIALAKKAADERIANAERAQRSGIFSADAVARVQAAIAKDLADDEVRIREDALAQLDSLGADEIVNKQEQYAKLVQEHKIAAANQVSAEKALQEEISKVQQATRKKQVDESKGTYEAIQAVANEAYDQMIAVAYAKNAEETEFLFGFLEQAKKTYDEFVKVNRTAYESALKEVKKYASEIKKVEDQIVDDESNRQADLLEIRRRGMDDQALEASLTKEYQDAIAASQNLIKAGEVGRAAEAAERAITIAKGFETEKKALSLTQKAYDQLEKVRESEKSDIGAKLQVAIDKAAGLNLELERSNTLMKDLATKAGDITFANDVDLSFNVPSTLREDVQKIMDETGVDIGLNFNPEEAQKAQLSIQELMKDVKVTPGLDTEGMSTDLETWNTFAQKAFEDSKYEIQIDTTAAQAALDDMLDNFFAAMDQASRASAATSNVPTVRNRLGGFIPGWGGGDKVRALLEKGEFVLRKEAVAKYGLGLIQSLNALSFGGTIRRQNGGPVNDIVSTPIPGQIKSQESGETKVLKFTFDDGATTGEINVHETDMNTIISQFTRMGRLSST